MNANGAAVEHRYGRPILSSLHGLWSIGGFVAAGTTALVTALGRAGRAPPRRRGDPSLGMRRPGACTRLMPAAERPGDRRAGSRTRPSRRVLGLALISLAVFLAEGAINDWGALYLRTSLGESATVAAAGYAVFVGSMALMRLTGDRLTAHARAACRIVRIGAALGGDRARRSRCSSSSPRRRSSRSPHSGSASPTSSRWS